VAYPQIADRTTLYVSKKDRAIYLSGCWKKYSRAGITPPITIVGGVDTIDVSDVDQSLIGHSYPLVSTGILLSARRQFSN
jgi:Alpha/beta hydrolase of unknown function (DUF900)